MVCRVDLKEGAYNGKPNPASSTVPTRRVAVFIGPIRRPG
jgi:hypothetical protein